jgi:hypothetical protein
MKKWIALSIMIFSSKLALADRIISPHLIFETDPSRFIIGSTVHGLNACCALSTRKGGPEPTNYSLPSDPQLLREFFEPEIQQAQETSTDIDAYLENLEQEIEQLSLNTEE